MDIATKTEISTRYAGNLKHFNNSPVRSVLNKLSAGLLSNEIIKDTALQEMIHGTLPDMRSVCHDLFKTFQVMSAPFSALQFVETLSGMVFNRDMIVKFENNLVTNHVLVQNQWLKVVLIRWNTNDESKIHGHPGGGCVFKVLKGKLIENRYSTDCRHKFLSGTILNKDTITYIDDRMGYHSVGNPFTESAISIHVYDLTGLK